MRYFTMLLTGLLVAVLMSMSIAPAARAEEPSSNELLDQLESGGSLDRDEVRQLLNKWWYLTDSQRQTVNQAAAPFSLDKAIGDQGKSNDDDDDDDDDDNDDNNGYVAPTYWNPGGFVLVNPGVNPPGQVTVPGLGQLNRGLAAPLGGTSASLMITNGPYGPLYIPAPPYDRSMSWGSFGTYQNWANQFALVHGRLPNVQDEIDFWASQAYAAQTGVSPYGPAPFSQAGYFNQFGQYVPFSQ